MAKTKQPLSLLIVDDEDDLREILQELFSPLVENTAGAPNGLAALEMITEGNFDAALVDINMPKMSGLELIKALRERGNNIPIVILSAHGDRKNTLEALRLGAYDFIDKPFDSTVLKAVVMKALEEGADMRIKEEALNTIFRSLGVKDPRKP
ncbi:MAG: response regulator [Bdellovibrionales bacterium]|nr:response regulator [Bdellovibrionales bacterium]